MKPDGNAFKLLGASGATCELLLDGQPVNPHFCRSVTVERVPGIEGQVWGEMVDVLFPSQLTASELGLGVFTLRFGEEMYEIQFENLSTKLDMQRSYFTKVTFSGKYIGKDKRSDMEKDLPNWIELREQIMHRIQADILDGLKRDLIGDVVKELYRLGYRIKKG